MADIRIKDLATTASTTASDDFMAVDGTTNGTRKLSAATPSFATSVTVPGVAGPTSTDLTLAGGSTGASLVLGQGTTKSTLTKDYATNVLGSGRLLTLIGDDGNTLGRVTELAFGVTGSTNSPVIVGAVVTSATGYGTKDLYFATRSSIGDVAPTERARLTSTGNLLIGGTTDIPGSGGLKVFGTTAASSTTSGALQVAGGVGVAGAGYFGGVLNVAGDASFSSGTFSLTGGAGSYGLTISNTSTTTRLTTSFGGSSLGFRVNAAGSDQLTVSGSAVNVPLTTPSTGVGTGALQVAGGIYAGAASVFGGAVTAGGQIKTISASTPDLWLQNSSGATSAYRNILLRQNADGTAEFLSVSDAGVLTRANILTLNNDSGAVGVGMDATGTNAFAVAGLIFPQQAITASAPTYVKGAIYFDTTLNKLRVGGATGWETITSV